MNPKHYSCKYKYFRDELAQQLFSLTFYGYDLVFSLVSFFSFVKFWSNTCIYVFFFSHSERENRDLDILIFHEVLDTMARVDRVLTKPGGSLLMAGRSGVGRRTAVSLIAHMHQMQMFTPKISRGYSLKNFKNDLKTVIEI